MNNAAQTVVHPFAPIYDAHSRVLILEMCIRDRWSMIEEVFGAFVEELDDAEVEE